MSAALERVIAEQQAEIDRYKALEKHNIEAWSKEHDKGERVVMWAFRVLDNPESPECLFELKKAIIDWGYCPTCECSPCECDYDD